MARKPRLFYPGAVYHVLLRGNAGQDIFYEKEDRKYFYRLLRGGHEKFGHRIHTFCLMANHVHLAMQVSDTPFLELCRVSVSDTQDVETGVHIAQTKAITYDMIKNAYETLIGRGRFDSSDFREKYQNEYEAGPCRYSMVGGVLVELGVARLMSAGSNRSCYYLKI